MSTANQDLSNFAAFDLDDLLAEIESSKTKKEVTAYLDRRFIAQIINEYHHQAEINPPDFILDSKINFTEYNFTGADLREIHFSDFALCNFKNCDISATWLDRHGIDFFRELMLAGEITAQGLNLSGAYLGPVLARRPELGIECYIYLNLSNLNLTGANFSKCDIEGLLLQNTNISGCNFTDCLNLDLKQFAFSIGFEAAIFSNNPAEDSAIKKQIKEYANSLDPAEFYTSASQKTSSKIMAYLAKLTNIFDD